MRLGSCVDFMHWHPRRERRIEELPQDPEPLPYRL
jgi:hypothetical protein